MKKQIITILLLGLLCVSFSGCHKKEEISARKSDSEDRCPQKEQIVLAMLFNEDEGTNWADGILQNEIDKYNQAHDDYEIVIKEYRQPEEMYDGNVTLIQREVVSGEGPDIINYRCSYNAAAVTGKYTVDLRQYIDADPEIKENLYANVLDAFSIDGGLYALPTSMQIVTLAGRKNDIGNVDRWDVQTMFSVLEKDGKKYPLGYANKSEALCRLMYASTDEYIDWEKGTNDFDSSEFRSILEFANQFEVEWNEEIASNCSRDDCSLNFMIMGDVFSTAAMEGELRTSDIVYPGFPCDNGCGSIVVPGETTIGISMASKHKEQCWEFMKQLLLDDYQMEVNDKCTMPVTKSAINQQLENAKNIEYVNGEKVIKANYSIVACDLQPIYNITDKQAEDMLNLIQSVDKSYSMNPKVEYVIYEEVDAYFAGQKTLDEVIKNIQSRIGIYISEKAAS